VGKKFVWDHIFSWRSQIFENKSFWAYHSLFERGLKELKNPPPLGMRCGECISFCYPCIENCRAFRAELLKFHSIFVVLSVIYPPILIVHDFVEGLLSDQLKLIYLEERDRIQKISSRYPINRFESRLHKTMPLNDRIRELTRIYNGSTSVVAKTNGVKKYRPVTELPCEGQGKRCECLNKHILFE
jgi:hypothetical protein